MSEHQPESLSHAIDALQQLDRAFKEEAPSAACDERVLATFRQAQAPTSQKAWPLGLQLSAIAALLLVVIGGYLVFHESSRSHRTLPGGFVLLEGKVRTSVQRGKMPSLACETASCRLHHPTRRVSLQLRVGGQVAHVKQRFYVWQGHFLFDVQKRSADEAAVAIQVSHGTVKVLGTRFSIHQRAAEGDMWLHRGRVALLRPTGEIVQLTPGNRVSWPVRSAPRPRLRQAPPVRIPTRVPARRMRRRRVRVMPKRRALLRRNVRRRRVLRRPTPRLAKRRTAPKVVAKVPVAKRLLPPKLMISDWLRRLATLRTMGNYALATRLLQRDLQRLGQPIHRKRYHQARELLHYELGSLYTHQLGQTRKACLHWKQHLVLFSVSRRYRPEVLELRRQLKCR